MNSHNEESTLLAVKIYTRTTYRQIIDFSKLTNKIHQYLHLKKNSPLNNTPKILPKPPNSSITKIKQTNIKESSSSK